MGSAMVAPPAWSKWRESRFVGNLPEVISQASTGGVPLTVSLGGLLAIFPVGISWQGPAGRGEPAKAPLLAFPGGVPWRDCFPGVSLRSPLPWVAWRVSPHRVAQHLVYVAGVIWRGSFDSASMTVVPWRDLPKSGQPLVPLERITFLVSRFQDPVAEVPWQVSVESSRGGSPMASVSWRGSPGGQPGWDLLASVPLPGILCPDSLGGVPLTGVPRQWSLWQCPVACTLGCPLVWSRSLGFSCKGLPWVVVAGVPRQGSPCGLPCRFSVTGVHTGVSWRRSLLVGPVAFFLWRDSFVAPWLGSPVGVSLVWAPVVGPLTGSPLGCPLAGVSSWCRYAGFISPSFHPCGSDCRGVVGETWWQADWSWPNGGLERSIDLAWNLEWDLGLSKEVLESVYWLSVTVATGSVQRRGRVGLLTWRTRGTHSRRCAIGLWPREQVVRITTPAYRATPRMWRRRNWPFSRPT
jgi:hypothetical protein